LTLGIALRFAEYWGAPSFWHDEAALACNISQRSFSELLQPLAFDQGAPLGFLALQRGVFLLLGGSERALRLLPFLSGIAALLVFPRVARSYLSWRGALIALALFALGGPVVHYGAQLKQYSSDLFFCLVLWGCAGDCLHRFRTDGAIRLCRWAVVGILALCCSHPAAFVLAGGAPMRSFAFAVAPGGVWPNLP
jgi:uncharacterized membrane protein